MVNMFLIGVVIVIAFCIWKFLIQPRMNEGKPIEPQEEDELNMFEALD